MKIALLIVLLSVHECSSVVGRVGQSVTLSCVYDVKRNGRCHVCWGRGRLPYSGCSSPLIYTDGSKVTGRSSDRYQLLGRLDRGDVSLTIQNLTESDAGRYGCRIEVSGLFNDIKHHVELTVEDAQTTTEPTGHTETSAGPAHLATAGQPTSTRAAMTSSSGDVAAEQQDGSSVIQALILALFGLVTVGTAFGFLIVGLHSSAAAKSSPVFPQENIYQTDAPAYTCEPRSSAH